MKLKDRIYEVVVRWLICDSFQVKKEQYMTEDIPMATYTITFQVVSHKAINKCDVLLRWLVRKYNNIGNEIMKRYE